MQVQSVKRTIFIKVSESNTTASTRGGSYSSQLAFLKGRRCMELLKLLFYILYFLWEKITCIEGGHSQRNRAVFEGRRGGHYGVSLINKREIDNYLTQSLLEISKQVENHILIVLPTYKKIFFFFYHV